MIFHINEPISPALVDRLANAYNTKEPNDTMFIYMCSGGGSIWAADVIVSMVNTSDTVLVAYGRVGSAAVSLFMNAPCTKALLKGTYFIVHQASWSVDVKETGHAMDKEDKLRVKLIKEYGNSETKKVCERLELTEEENKEVKEGQDVFITYNRLSKIFK